MLSTNSKVHLLVGATCLGALALVILGLSESTVAPSLQGVASFVFLTLLLQFDNTQLRVQATGSVAFMMHLAATMIFGGGWAAIIAASSGLIFVLKRSPAIKVAFNTAQFAVSVSVAYLAYRALGGGYPAAFLLEGASAASPDVKRDVLLFIVASGCYFLVNSLLVSAAIAFSAGRKFREVWYLNTRGVVAYDLAASALAIPVAIAYTKWQVFGLLLAVMPILAVRHFYGMYHKLQESGQEMLAVMVKAIEARDPYTSGHSERVSKFSRAIALELDLPSQTVEEITTAALLHDVGKIHEEFAPLLRKEARLTPEEMAVMQTHVIRSAELVGIVSKFRGRILEAVRHHHERWDGEGYPDGVQGKAIPLGARIILIADTVDAMTTDRPYRKALGLDVVLAELQRCKGTQFDPELVDIMANSVSIRRLITTANGSEGSQELGSMPLASRKVVTRVPPFWKRRGA